VVDQGGLARGLGAEDLDDPAAGEAAHAEREVERDRACRDRLDADGEGVVAHLHDRAGAELALDLPDRVLQRGFARLGSLLLFLVHGQAFPSRSEHTKV
jgi:hypothetical protein